MSINNFSSDLTETLWWSQQPPLTQPSSIHPKSLISQLIYNHQLSMNTPFNFNLNDQEDEEEDIDDQLLPDDRENYDRAKHQLVVEEEELRKEPMFEKPLTPSDVGKLNRLVIPKQHAEKYFPIGGGGGGSGDSGEKGLLLSFEDELGKSWRFRYSYWNSSQSYVLTKGWSRFVKEKRLDAGDVVLFERHLSDSKRLFIGWRRRITATSALDSIMAQPSGGGVWTRVLYSGHPYPSHPKGLPLPYQPHCLHATGRVVQQNQRTESGNLKTLRLFGVNMECQPAESSSSPSSMADGSLMSQQAQTQAHHHQNYPYNPPHDHVSNYQNHMDFNSSRDVMEQMRRYHQG